jgi:hypothetical protein
VSERFQRELFGMRDIAESRPNRVVNWRIVRWLAASACLFWLMAIGAILIDDGSGAHWDVIWFALGLTFAGIAATLRLSERFWRRRWP